VSLDSAILDPGELSRTKQNAYYIDELARLDKEILRTISYATNIALKKVGPIMAQTQRRPRGRPPKPEAERKLTNIIMRVRDATRLALEDAAEANGRSLSRECEARLEFSLRDQGIFENALNAEYGEGTAGVLALIQRVIKHVADQTLRGRTWTKHAFTFDQAISAIIAVLDALRPPGDPGDPTSFAGEENIPWSYLWQWPPQKISKMVALLALNDAIHPSGSMLAEKLGPELVERIRAGAPDKILRAWLTELVEEDDLMEKDDQ